MANARLGFRRKLTFGFTAIALVSMVVCGSVSYLFTSSIVNELTLGNLHEQIKGIESAILISHADNLGHLKKSMGYWTGKVLPQIEIRPGEQDSVTAENQMTHEKAAMKVPALYVNGKKLVQHDFVDLVSDQSGNAITLFVRAPGGFYRVSTSVKKSDGSRNVGTFVPESSHVYQSLAKGERFVGRALVAGSWYLTAYEPIAQKGEVVGSFFMGIPETSFTLIKDALKSRKILQTGYIYILDSAGQMVVHPAKEGENVLATTDLDGRAIFKDIIEKKTGQIEYRWLNAETQKPQRKLAFFRYLPEMDWYVAASVNLDEARAPVTRLEWILFLIAAIMTGLMALATIFFGGYVARKLVPISSGLEASGLQVSQSSRELAKVADDLAQSTEKQASGLQQTVSSIEEIRAMVSRNLEGTRVTESLSRQVSESAVEGQQILDTLARKVQTIASTNDSLQEEMKSSHQQFERIIGVISEIGKKTQIINEIVFQTKLLSFNASVEAARAGEHGKGFSVVAEEVGRLAALSGAAAGDIRQSLERSQAEVGAIIQQARSKTEALITASETQIREGVAISIDCSATFGSILQQASQTHQAIEGITHASREQTQGIEEINGAMLQLDEVTQRNSASAHQVKSLATQLHADSVEMETAVHELGIFLNGDGTGEGAARALDSAGADRASTAPTSGAKFGDARAARLKRVA